MSEIGIDGQGTATIKITIEIDELKKTLAVAAGMCFDFSKSAEEAFASAAKLLEYGDALTRDWTLTSER